MTRKAFEAALGNLKTELTLLREKFRMSVLCCLLKHKAELAAMSDGQLEEAAVVLDGLCTHNQLLKVRMNGLGTMPDHLVFQEGLSARTWMNESIPAKVRKLFSDPKGVVLVAHRNARVRREIEKLKEQEFRSVMPASCPEHAPIPPELQNSAAVSKPRYPEYFTLIGVEELDGDIILVGAKDRPITGKMIVKLRVTGKQLSDVLAKGHKGVGISVTATAKLM